MSLALFILYWPDFSAAPDDVPYPPPLLAHSLKRQLLGRHEDFAGYVWVAGTAQNVSGVAFQRWGLRVVEEPPSGEFLQDLLVRHPGATRLILAGSPDRCAAVASRVQGRSLEVEFWTPRGAAMAADTPSGPQVIELEQALHLRTAVSVGLFADWRHVSAQLQQEGVAPERSALMEGLLRCAELAGSVVAARLYGTAEDDPGARNGPADDMCESLLRLLTDPFAPRTWVLVADAPWLPQVISRAHAHDIRVLLWPIGENSISLPVRMLADGYSDLREFLPQSLLTRARRSSDLQVVRTQVRSTVHHQGGGHDEPTVEHAVAVLSDPEEQEPESELDRLPELPRSGGHPPPLPPPGARLSPWVRLIYRVETTLREQHWSRIAFRRLAALLAENDEFGPTPTHALAWLNRARAEGLLLMEQETLRGEPGLKITACRPNPEHPIFRAAIDVPDRILRLLRQMLQKMPWVSFKLLRSVLIREQWLGGGAYGLDESGIDEWINFLIQDGAIRMTKEPNLTNPEYPVTALRLNESHPLSSGVVTEAVEGARLAAERAILAVDHFMIRNRKPWMAMSALRRALDAMGREELQAVLEGLQNLGVLITESYPNPQKEHLTTGCRLKTDETIVVEAFRMRNSIIRITQQMQRFRSWIPLSRVDEELDSVFGTAGMGMERLAWFALLRDEGILEFDQDVLPTNGWESIRCRLNLTDGVVRTVVSEGDVPPAL